MCICLIIRKRLKNYEVAGYPANGYIAGGIVYTSAVTRDAAGRVTRNQLRESGDQVQGMWTSYPAYGYIAKGIRYTASANGDVGAGDLE